MREHAEAPSAHLRPGLERRLISFHSHAAALNPARRSRAHAVAHWNFLRVETGTPSHAARPRRGGRPGLADEAAADGGRISLARNLDGPPESPETDPTAGFSGGFGRGGMARDPRERWSAERARSRGERAEPRQRGETRSGAGSGPTTDPRELFAGGSPREVLGRLLDGDPLDIGGRTRSKLKEKALLLDVERWTLRSMARVAFAAPRWDGTTALLEWIDGLVDRAASDLLDEDRAALQEPSA